MAERDLFLAALVKKGFDGVNKKIDTLAAVAGENASWASVKKVVAAGMAMNAYPIGTQFTVSHKKYGNLLFDVVAHNHHKNPNDPNAPTMTLLMHNTIYGMPFDDSEAAFCVSAKTYPSGLPAGTYHFLVHDSFKSEANLEGWAGIQFTTTKTVPVGGQVVLAGWIWNVNISTVKIKTYATNSSADAIESGVVLSNGTGGASLGTLQGNGGRADGVINHYFRVRYGNNNWNESNIRQWLNADADANWWTPTHSLDRLAPAYATLPGFLNGFDAEFVAALGPIDAVTRKNNVFENDNETGNVVYTTRDKVFLLSNDEVGFGVEGIAQGSVVDFYKGAANADRIKYDYNSTATARNWWLRSPIPGYANGARYVITSGAQNNLDAYGGLGAAAACVIY